MLPASTLWSLTTKESGTEEDIYCKALNKYINNFNISFVSHVTSPPDVLCWPQVSVPPDETILLQVLHQIGSVDLRPQFLLIYLSSLWRSCLAGSSKK